MVVPHGEPPGDHERGGYTSMTAWRRTNLGWANQRANRLLKIGRRLQWVDSEGDKHALIASEPEKPSATPHHDGHPTVLVNMKTVGAEEATELITESWRLRAPKKAVKEWDGVDG